MRRPGSIRNHWDRKFVRDRDSIAYESLWPQCLDCEKLFSSYVVAGSGLNKLVIVWWLCIQISLWTADNWEMTWMALYTSLLMSAVAGCWRENICLERRTKRIGQSVILGIRIFNRVLRQLWSYCSVFCVLEKERTLVVIEFVWSCNCSGSINKVSAGIIDYVIPGQAIRHWQIYVWLEKSGFWHHTHRE